MSLESAIEANTAALRELAQLLKSSGAVVSGTGLNAPEASSSRPAKMPKPAISPPAGQKAASPPEPAPKPAAALGFAYTYADVSKATIDLAAAKGRQVAVDLLAKYGAKNAKELKPEQYADYMALVLEVRQA